MTLLKKHEREATAFVEVCRHLARNMYVTGYGGNLAWKLEEDLILITPTQMNKGDVEKEDVVFIDRAGKKVEGKRRPTGEMPMYLKFFAEREDIASVVHCHPPYVCAMAIRKGKNWLMRPFFPETVTEVGPAPLTPYGEPLTEELARSFSPFLRKYNSFVMQNHGLVTMSRGGIEWTLHNVELLEMSAMSIAIALSMGEMRELTREEVRNLGNVMRMRELPQFGAPGVNRRLEDLYYPEE